MAKDSAVFETQSVDLATFLMLEGVEFLGCQRSDKKRNVVILRFSDPANKCLDLERIYISSDFKRYRDFHKWLLGKIHEKLRED